MRGPILPTERSSVRVGLQNLSVLLYGPSKVGKSTFSSQADGALFLATEPGLNALDVFEVSVTSWELFLSACAEIEAENHPFKTIIVDTVDNLYRLIVDHVRAKLGIAHESDLGFGKAYGLINGEFHRVLSKLAFMPYGLILVSHSEERELNTRTGRTTRFVPSLPDKARRVVLDLVDIIAFCEVVEDPERNGAVRRVIRTKPHPRYEAGDRTGLLPEELPLDFHAFKTALERAKGENNDAP
jgi:hypothetical protein